VRFSISVLTAIGAPALEAFWHRKLNWGCKSGLNPRTFRLPYADAGWTGMRYWLGTAGPPA
jgi:hypothetical protein